MYNTIFKYYNYLVKQNIKKKKKSILSQTEKLSSQINKSPVRTKCTVFFKQSEMVSPFWMLMFLTCDLQL